MGFSSKLQIDRTFENPLDGDKPTDLYFAVDQWMHADRTGIDKRKGQGPGRIYMARQLVAGDAYAAAHDNTFGEVPLMTEVAGTFQGKDGKDTHFLPSGAMTASAYWGTEAPFKIPRDKLLTLNMTNCTVGEVQIMRRIVDEIIAETSEKVRILMVGVPEHTQRLTEIVRNHCRWWMPKISTEILITDHEDIVKWVRGRVDEVLEKEIARVFAEELLPDNFKDWKIESETSLSMECFQLIDNVATFLTGSRGVFSPYKLGANILKTDDGIHREQMPDIWKCHLESTAVYPYTSLKAIQEDIPWDAFEQLKEKQLNELKKDPSVKLPPPGIIDTLLLERIRRKKTE